MGGWTGGSGLVGVGVCVCEGSGYVRMDRKVDFELPVLEVCWWKEKLVSWSQVGCHGRFVQLAPHVLHTCEQLLCKGFARSHS